MLTVTQIWNGPQPEEAFHWERRRVAPRRPTTINQVDTPVHASEGFASRKHITHIYDYTAYKSLLI